MLKLPGSLLARFLHPARRIAPKAILRPAAASLLRPSPAARARRNSPATAPERTGSPGPPWRTPLPPRAEGEFSLHYYLHYLEVHFHQPSWRGLFPLPAGIWLFRSESPNLSFPLRFYFGSEDKWFSAGRWGGGGGGLFRLGGGGGEHPAWAGRRGLVCWKLRRSWDRRPTAPAHGWGWSELQPLPLPGSSEAGYILKKPNCKQLWRCQNSPPSDTALLRRFPQAGLFLLFALPSSATIIKALVW